MILYVTQKNFIFQNQSFSIIHFVLLLVQSVLIQPELSLIHIHQPTAPKYLLQLIILKIIINRHHKIARFTGPFAYIVISA